MTPSYQAAVIRSEVDRVLSAAPGTRNGVLNAAAYNVGRVVGTDRAAASELFLAALAAKLPRQEALATIRSGMTHGARNPRVVSTSRAVGHQRPVSAPAPVPTPVVPTDNRPRALALWSEAHPIHGTLAATYLREVRRIHIAPDALRFHPWCPAIGGGWHPSLLAMVCCPRTGSFQAIQRTSLRPDGSGKAEIAQPRGSLGSTRGGGVIVGDRAAERWIVGEGVETLLTAMQTLAPHEDACGAATLSVGTLGGLDLPDTVERVTFLREAAFEAEFNRAAHALRARRIFVDFAEVA
jgi:hypothetical protein